MKRFIIALSLILGAAAQAAILTTPGNVHITQRGATGRAEDRNLLGLSNLWEVWAFNGSGVLTTLTAAEWFAGAGFTVGSAQITDGTIAADDIADGAVTSAKILDATISAGDLASDSVTSAKITDGTIATADVADSAVTAAKIASGVITNTHIAADAAIALSKLATDPLARANHTGTQTMSTISDAGALATLNAVGSAQITDGAIATADIADAAVTVAKTTGLGTTNSGTWGSPITGTVSPTWATNDYNLIYGGTGTINLPAVASYNGKTIFITSTGTFTITVAPNGSELIMEDGVSLGAGAADVLSATAGTFVGYTGADGRWIKREAGGPSGFPNPATEALNMGGHDIENAGAITATTVEANLSGSTAIPGSEIVGPLPDLIYGKITTAKGMVYETTTIAATTGANITVQTGVAENTITLNEATETVVFDAQPEDGKVFMVRIIAHSSACTVTWPSTWSFVTGGLRTSFVVPANKPQLITVWRDSVSYKMSGDPLEIAELPEDTTPAITASVPIDQGAGTERTSLANIRDALGVTFNGTAATPNTDATVAVGFDRLSYYHHSGATQELDLPASAGYIGRGIAIRAGGSYTVTVDPNGSETIDLNGTATSAGEAVVITMTAGQTAIFGCDSSGWFVSGGSATFAEATP